MFTMEGFKMAGKKLSLLIVFAALSAPISAQAQSVEEGVAMRIEGRHDRSFRVFEHLAQEGVAEAQLELGRHYFMGWGVERDNDEAFHWFSLAADQGNADAQYEVAYAYWDGIGVAQNQQEGLRRFRLLGEQGHINAQAALGDFYRDGKGVEVNPEEAIRWYSLAAAQGDDWARQNLTSLTGIFDPAAPVCADLYNTIATSRAFAANMVAQTASADAAAATFVTSTFGRTGIDYNDQAWRRQGAFWAFSNARLIDFAARRDALRERAPNELAFDIAMTGISGERRFPIPTSAEAGFGVGRVAPDAPPPQRAETPPYGQKITACDEAHGFTPVFLFGTDPG